MSTGYGGNKGKDGKYNTLNLTTYKGRSVDTSKPSGNLVRHGLQSLGKVASTRRVPPPASLPSLKSENLGNDPNVNLVPKDGSGWASKPDQPSPQQQNQPQIPQNVSQPSKETSSSTSYITKHQNPQSNLSDGNSRRKQQQSSSVPTHPQTWGLHMPPGGGRPPTTHGVTPFSEEFPTLNAPGKDGEQAGADSSEQPYGPGPSLRPQNVASWREGGGRNLGHTEQQSAEQEISGQKPTPQTYEMQGVQGNQHNITPQQQQQQHQQRMIMLQQQSLQYRPNMMPPYMYNNRFRHPGMAPPGSQQQGSRFPPNVSQPGMRFPYPNEPRFRAMPPATTTMVTSSSYSQQESSRTQYEDTKDSVEDGGWASMQGEVDYSEKLIFSDDEDTTPKKSYQSNKTEKSENYTDTSNNNNQQQPTQRPKFVPPRQAWPTQQQHNMEQQHSMQQQQQWQQQQQQYYNNNMPAAENKSGKYDKQRKPPYGHFSTAPNVYSEEDGRRKNEKEEALERARKRREEEENRMDMERRRLSESEHEGQSYWQRSSEQPHKHDGYRGVGEGEASFDDRKYVRDQNYGSEVYHRSSPLSSHGNIGGRNLPPRLAQQRQQQERWNQQQRLISPSGYSYSMEQPSSWDNNQHHGEVSKVTSIMKRSESEDVDSGSARSRKISEGSSHSQHHDSEERRSYNQRYNKDDTRATAGDREQRLWDVGPEKRGSINRQRSRESPVSTGNNSRRGSQKLTVTRTDSGRFVSQGDSQLPSSLGDFDKHNQQVGRPRRGGGEKVKLRNFRVDADEDSAENKSQQQSTGIEDGSQNSSRPTKSWKKDVKVSKPVATVSPSTSTNVASRSKSSKADTITASITRDVVSTVTESQSSLGPTRTRDPKPVFLQSEGSLSDENRTNNFPTQQQQATKESQPQFHADDRRPRRENNRGTDTRRNGNSRDVRPRENNRSERGYQGRNPDPNRSSRYDNRRDNKPDYKKKESYVKPIVSDPTKGNKDNTPPMTGSDVSKPTKPLDKEEPSILNVGKSHKIADPPATNVWEERKKQQKLVQPKELEEKFTFTPQEHDKKRTLKETAPPPVQIKSSIQKARDEVKSIPDNSEKSAPVKPKPKLEFYDSRSRRFNNSDGNTDRHGNVDDSRRRDNYDDRPRQSVNSRSRRGGDRRRGSASQTYRSTEPYSAGPRPEQRGRGRGRSRGYGRGQSERGTTRGGRRGSSSYSSRPTSHPARKYNDKFTSDGSEGSTSFEETDEEEFIKDAGRKREEASEDSGSESYTEDEEDPPIKPVENKANTNSGEFVARGEPTRRGRGRGRGVASRGRGRGNPARSSFPLPSSGGGSGRNDSRRTEQVPRNPRGNPTTTTIDSQTRQLTSQQQDKRKRRTKQDQPPRFKNSTRRNYSDAPFNGNRARNRGNDRQDGNEDWETESEHSADTRKHSRNNERSNDAKKSEAKRSFTNQRPSNDRQSSRGGRSNLTSHHKGPIHVDKQVFSIHTVNYTNPSAIEGALNQGISDKKMEQEIKTKNEEVFRMYDLSNYAGVINADDIPGSTRKSTDADVQESIDILLHSLPPPGGETGNDDDGFTPVLSKRAQRKKLEETRKKDKEEQLLEATRKARLEQKQQKRNKLIKSGMHVISGSSGSIKQASNNTWSIIDTWEPKESSLKKKLEKAEVSHDSGVESSVTSSQRSSPGTEAKLSFSHFGSVTSTSIVTSVCGNLQTPSMTSMIQTPLKLSANISTSPKLSSSLSSINPISSSTHSPSRLSGNPIGPIGNERVKVSKQPVENMTSIFPTMNDKNAISFIADEDISKVIKVQGNLFPTDVLSSTNSYSPFGEPPNTTLDVSQRNFKGYQKSDFSDDHSDRSIPTTNYNPLATFSTPSASPKPSELNLGPGNTDMDSLSSFIHMPQTSGIFSPLTTKSLNKAGESDPPEDMPLTPQPQPNPGARQIEGKIPAPIPLPPKHAVSNVKGEGDGIRQQSSDVNPPPTNGGGDMGLMTPTSPSIDLNLKMELGRKAWENMPSQSLKPASQPGNANESYAAYHTSTSAGDDTEPIIHSSIPPADINVTQASEWEPGTSISASVSNEESWKTTTQQSQSGISGIESKESIKSPSIAPNEPVIPSGNFTPDSQAAPLSMSQQQLATPQIASTYNIPYVYHSEYQYPQQHRSGQPTQSTIYHQPISSQSLATNLQQMQQFYGNMPQDYGPNMYSGTPTVTYNSLSQQPHSYNPPQHSDYSLMSSSTAPPTGKPSTAPATTTIKSNQQQPAATVMRGNALQATYGTPSSMAGQQTNPLTLPRPHGGAPSPAQQFHYIPLVDQNQVVSGNQATPANLINRPQSTSFFSSLNQGSSFYPPQAQIRQQPAYHPHHQQTIPPLSYQQGVYQQMKAMSPSPGAQLTHDSFGNPQQSSFAPIAPPSQRIRATPDFSTPFYYEQAKPQHLAQKQVTPSTTPTFSSTTGKPNLAISAYSVKPPMYGVQQKPDMGQQAQISKYAFTNISPSGGMGYQGQTDWGKIQNQGAQMQPNKTVVQGILSRPFSSSGDTSYQQTTPSYQQQPPPHQKDSLMGYQQFQPATLWKPSMNPQQPSILGKPPPRMPIAQQRFPSPQQTHNFQPGMIPQMQAGVRMPRGVNHPSTRMPMQGGSVANMPVIGTFHTTDTNQSKQGKKAPQGGGLQGGKAPPVPTLVRGGGSNLVGKKPTFFPEEVVKSNQASERANLLQSLSNFFPGKEKTEQQGENGEENSWSAQVANSSPLPQRKPGMRHPGVDKRRGKGGPLNKPRYQDEEIPIQSTKKLTLADTKPKKGEISTNPRAKAES